jgi:uncharacterized membrane protein YjfL (UPF0719 family)
MNRKLAVRLSPFVALALAATAFAQDKAAETVAPHEEKGILALVIGLVLAIVALFVSLGLAMKAVQVAINMFDKITKGVDEWAELKKGNVAIGILMAAVIYAIANVISSGVTALTSSLMNPSWSWAYIVSIVIGVVNLVIALWIGTYVVGLTIRILDKMTKNIEEMDEIAKGNVAVAILVAGVLIGVSTVVSQGVEGLSKVVNVQSVLGALGIKA